MANPTEQLPTTSPSLTNPSVYNQAKPVKRFYSGKPKKGDLVAFRYTFWKHDPHPLVLVTSIYQDGKVAGVNLHNLTIVDMKNLVYQYCNKPISYESAVKGRKEISKGFRTYKWNGVKDLNVLDCNNFLKRLGVVREKKLLSPSEVEKVRSQIQQQLRRQINPFAKDLTKYVKQQIEKKSGTIPSIPGIPASIPGIKSGE